VTILAGGSSLHPDDVEAVRGRTRVIAVNDAWRFAPWADVLYGADWPWWEHWQGVPDFPGEKWTQDKPSGGVAPDPDRAREWGINIIRSEDRPGISFTPGVIHQGGNSGFQAVNLAVLWGVSKILLLGFDMGGSHWFKDRPAKFNKGSDFSLFIKAFELAAPQIEHMVINCSRRTALTCFRRMAIYDALGVELRPRRVALAL